MPSLTPQTKARVLALLHKTEPAKRRQMMRTFLMLVSRLNKARTAK